MAYGVQDKTTCTACAGTLLLEFAALTRLTGNPEFEVSLPPCPLWGKLQAVSLHVHSGESFK